MHLNHDWLKEVDFNMYPTDIFFCTSDYLAGHSMSKNRSHCSHPLAWNFK